jgi:hypothetical protein
MSNEQKEPWLNHLALTTVIFAVCATLSTFKGGGYSTKSVISQEQASDQWNFYQAKNIRESLYIIQKENLELKINTLDKQDTDKALQKYKQALLESEKNIDKYEQQKKEIEQTARSFEIKRDDAQKHGQPFGIAVIFLQIAILLSSISGLFKKKSLWYTALPIGLAGILYFIDGFFLFI